MTETETMLEYAERQGAPDVWTIGHSTLALDELVERLTAHGIRRVADVRRYPASRRNPQFARETLAEFLEARAIGYRWFPELGGRRPGAARGASPNLGLTSPGFRQYADYAGTAEFHAALEDFLDWAREERTALLCAEALWWRCHRRLIADRLVAIGGRVHHVLSNGEAEPHRLWDLARVVEGGLVYPPEQGELPLGPPQTR